MSIGNKILLLISERIGDVIFCTPAIQLLKNNLPANAIIAAITPSAGAASVLAHNPAIQQVYVAPTKKQLAQLTLEYSAVIDLHNSKQTQIYRNNLNLPAYVSPRHRKSVHQSTVALNFITALLSCPTPTPQNYLLYPQDEHYKNIENLLTTAGVDLQQDILIGCHMGCNQVARKGLKFWKKTNNHKSWPIKKFIAVEKKLTQHDKRIRFVLTGSASESKLCQQLLQQSENAIDLAGKTSVLDMAALMQYLKVFLTGDTGPLHIACATPIPIVALFGPTSPLETGPYPAQPQRHIIQQTKIEYIDVNLVCKKILDSISFNSQNTTPPQDTAM